MKGNFVDTGTIVAVDPSNRKLVRVQLFDRVTNWLPYQGIANKFFKLWIPPRVGEQVTVLIPFGEADGGIVSGSIFNKGCKEPDGANDHTFIMEFEDGARIVYDTESHNLSLSTIGAINMAAEQGVHIDADLYVSKTITDEKGSVTEHRHKDVAPGSSLTGLRS